MPAALLSATRVVALVDVPAWVALALEGRGAPGDDGLQRAISLVHGIACALKAARKGVGRDFSVSPVEVCWWTEGGRPLAEVVRAEWRWRARMAVPEDVQREELLATVRAAVTRKRGRLAGERAAELVELERIPAQRLARMLHAGPTADTPRSFARLHESLARQALKATPGHLEVYLTDPRRTAPERLRTVLLVEVVGGVAQPAAGTPDAWLAAHGRE